MWNWVELIAIAENELCKVGLSGPLRLIHYTDGMLPANSKLFNLSLLVASGEMFKGVTS